MDWLIERQGRIEQRLAKRHLKNGSLVLFDLTSSYFEGVTCPLAKLGREYRQSGWRASIGARMLVISFSVAMHKVQDRFALLLTSVYKRGGLIS
jgi:hypothetical protein